MQVSQLSPQNLADIEGFLTMGNYLSRKNQPGAEDAIIYSALEDVPNRNYYPNLFAWYTLLSGISDDVKNSWIDTVPNLNESQEINQSNNSQEEVKKDEIDDLFKDDPEDEKRFKELVFQRKAALMKKEKVKPQKSVMVFVVKILDPWETDVNALAGRIMKIQMDGFEFVQYQVIRDYTQRINIQCILEDGKCPDDLFDEILASEDDYVQSIDILVFKKLEEPIK